VKAATAKAIDAEPVFEPAGQPDYPAAIWRPAYPGHWYTSGNGRHFVVIHDMEGYYLSTISYFSKLQHAGQRTLLHQRTEGQRG
jgi:hypothetical protein